MPRIRIIYLLGSILLLLLITCCVTFTPAKFGQPATLTPKVLQSLGVVQIAPPPTDLRLGGLVWSPDSSRLAVTHYLNVVPGGTIQTSLYHLDIHNRELTLIREVDRALNVIAWFPGNRMGFAIPSYGENNSVETGTWLMDADGNEPPERILKYDAVVWSPDERHVATYIFERGAQFNTRSILMYDLQSGQEQELVKKSGNAVVLYPLAWSPDGSKILFEFDDPIDDDAYTSGDIYLLEIDTGKSKKLTQINDNGSASWSPNGELIAFIEAEIVKDETQTSLNIMRSDGSCHVNFITSNSQYFGSVNWSPDGRWIAFNWNKGIYLLDTEQVLGKGYEKYYDMCP